MDKSILIGGKLTDVDDSAVDSFIIKGSKWFTANYNEFVDVLKLVYKDYDKFTDKSDSLKIENKDKEWLILFYIKTKQMRLTTLQAVFSI